LGKGWWLGVPATLQGGCAWRPHRRLPELCVTYVSERNLGRISQRGKYAAAIGDIRLRRAGHDLHAQFTRVVHMGRKRLNQLPRNVCGYLSVRMNAVDSDGQIQIMI